MTASPGYQWNKSILVAFLSVGLSLCCAQYLQAADSTVTIQGIGYPPIKAVNKRQALLMARRAAVLDAYGKILWHRTDHSTAKKVDNYFLHLSGFVRGLNITDEELLPDGGVRIKATVEQPGFIAARPSTGRKSVKKQEDFNLKFAPKIITRQQWFKVISSMVTFETDTFPKETTQ